MFTTALCGVSTIFLLLSLRYLLEMDKPLEQRFNGATAAGIVSIAFAVLAIAIKYTSK